MVKIFWLLAPTCMMVLFALVIPPSSPCKGDMKVVKVRALKGSIQNLSKNKQNLLEKAVFNCQDTLLFSSLEDRILTLGPDQLNYLVKPAASLKTYTISVLPDHVDIRPGRLLTPLDFQLFFKEYRLLALGKETRLKFSLANFPLSQENYFVVYYQRPGSPEPAEVKISVVDQELVLHQDTLFPADLTLPDPDQSLKLNLFYRRSLPGGDFQFDHLGAPDITFADTAILKQEIGALLSSDPPAGTKRLEQLEKYLFLMYEGVTVNRRELQKWVKKHFDLNI